MTIAIIDNKCDDKYKFDLIFDDSLPNMSKHENCPSGQVELDLEIVRGHFTSFACKLQTFAGLLSLGGKFACV